MKLVRDVRSVESEKTKNNVRDAFGGFVRPWHRVANVGLDPREAMTLQFGNINNLKKLVWIWGMYSGVV